MPRYRAMVFVPAALLIHVPPADDSAGAGRRLAKVPMHCIDFDAGRCTRGQTCRYVHANVEGLPPLPTHVNFAWRSLDACTFPRLPPGNVYDVAAPNSARAVDRIPSEAMLVTRATETRRRLTHCAHYYFNRSCRMGAQCGFVHAVYVDDEAKLYQLAPGPSEMPDRPQVPSKKQRLSSSRSLMEHDECSTADVSSARRRVAPS